MKKYHVFIIAAVAILSAAFIAGCSKPKQEEPQTPAPTEETTEAVTQAPTETPAEPQTPPPVAGTDAVKFQLTGIDDDLGMALETGIDAIILTESGRLTFMTHGDLAENVGKEVTDAMDVKAVDLFNYGNGGYRVIVFVRNDGTLSAIDPVKLIEDHEIEILDNLGGLKDVVEVYEESGPDGTVIVARTADDETTVVDPFLE